MSYLTPEGIARRVQTLYEDYYNDALDAVEAAWSSTEDITLYDFERREIVSDPSNMIVFKQFPALGIGIGELAEDTGGNQVPQLYANYYLLNVQCVYFLKGLDMHQLGIVILRHIEATLRFLQQHAHLDFDDNVSTRNIRFEPSANVFQSGGNLLVKGLRVSFDVRFMQRGF